MKTALSNKHISKNDINEVIFIGRSTRIPKVKEFINVLFDNKVKINDTINADVPVDYRATQPEKILYNRDQFISNLNILDITSFILCVSIKNTSQDKEIQKEGEEMSVIIKWGTPLPVFNTKLYETVTDNQTRVRLKIYEGEKKSVKYNHLLTETIKKVWLQNQKVKLKFQLNLILILMEFYL